MDTALSAPMVVEPVTLLGEHVRLEPLSPDHLDGLCEVGLDAAIWRWMPVMVTTRAAMQEVVDAALAAARAGTMLPFTTIDRASGRAVGGTRYLNIDRENRHLEIGYTWIAPAWQRSVVNTEAKLLMLAHAFEALGCHRVEFKTDSLNDRSRAALARIGAVEEGTFRDHMVVQHGRLRHSAYFSIVGSEWPSVQARLQARIAAGPRG